MKVNLFLMSPECCDQLIYTNGRTRDLRFTQC